MPAKRDEFRLADPHRQLPAAPAAAAAQPRQLHHLARPADALAGAEGRSARRGRVSRASPARQPLFNDDGSVAGVQLGDMGIEKNGEPGPNYTPGAEIRARTTVIAEGARGSLAKQLIRRFGLDAHSCPQTYGLGMKELWQLPAGRVEPGLIQHTLGWPLDSGTYGGSFIYHLDKNRVYVGFVVGLDYEDPRLSPFEAFQQFKHHPTREAVARGRRDPGRRRAHHRRRRLAVDSAPGDAGRHADRRLRRRREPAQDQRHPPGDPLRHAGRGAPGRGRLARRASMRAGAPRRAARS